MVMERDLMIYKEEAFQYILNQMPVQLISEIIRVISHSVSIYLFLLSTCILFKDTYRVSNIINSVHTQSYKIDMNISQSNSRSASLFMKAIKRLLKGSHRNELNDSHRTDVDERNYHYRFSKHRSKRANNKAKGLRNLLCSNELIVAAASVISLLSRNSIWLHPRRGSVFHVISIWCRLQYTLY